MDHQDWDPVIFKSSVPKATRAGVQSTETVMKYNAGKNTQTQSSSNARKIEKQVEEGDMSIPTVTYNLQVQMQQARQAKKWTQKELAQACNMHETVIRDYENGKVIPNSQDLVKMSRALGVTLRNK